MKLPLPLPKSSRYSSSSLWGTERRHDTMGERENVCVTMMAAAASFRNPGDTRPTLWPLILLLILSPPEAAAAAPIRNMTRTTAMCCKRKKEKKGREKETVAVVVQQQFNNAAIH